MTIDERLDRLVQRHETLPQSMELLTKDVRDLGTYCEKLPKVPLGHCTLLKFTSNI